jgi:glucose-6-phosphate 1-dehydrogenase
VVEHLTSKLFYVSGDYSDPATYGEIRRCVDDRRYTVSYLAIPPFLFDDVVRGLVGSGLHNDGRLVVEKPFGRDLKSAAELNDIIHRHYPESRVYRIDHFLGKEALQNLMVYRFSNSILEPIWNRHYIRGVQITMAEDFGVNGRGSFYDSVGALRDVVQNHLLVLIALLAMEPPVSDEPDALRDERVKVLRAMKALNSESVVRGQYLGYLGEPGVEPDSATETYFAGRFEIDSWRWAGVPWVVRAGKGMASTVTEAVVEFNRPPRLLFADADSAPGPNRLTFRSKPDDCITLSMQAKRAGHGMVSGPVDFSVEEGPDEGEARDAYHRLLGDALKGDQALFAREDGVMESWRIVEPVLGGDPPPLVYERGSWGPGEADVILGSDWEWLTT